MEMLKISDIQTSEKGTVLQGLVLIQGYTMQKTKTGSDYFIGDLMSGGKMTFKVWGNLPAFSKFRAEDYTGVPVYATITVDEYSGAKSAILTDVEAVEGYSAEDFMESKYDADAYMTSLYNTLKQSISDKGMTLLEDIFFSDKDLVQRFKLQFAASSHHDNCKGGLLAHTQKGLSIMPWLFSVYPNLAYGVDSNGELVRSQDRVDLMYIGFFMHDIGKLDEMEFGVYTRKSFITHRILGLGYLYKHKEKIVSCYDELWFTHLEAIIVQHHGEFGDDCRTLPAYVIHKIDCLEACMTNLNQMLPDGVLQGSNGLTISYDGRRLTL